MKSESEVVQSCPTLSDPMDCSPPGSSVHGIFPGKSTGVGCHCLLHLEGLDVPKWDVFYSSLHHQLLAQHYACSMYSVSVRSEIMSFMSADEVWTHFLHASILEGVAGQRWRLIFKHLMGRQCGCGCECEQKGMCLFQPGTSVSLVS